MPPFQPEPEQLAEFSRWLAHPDIIRKVAVCMPLVGGPASARECRVREVALALAAIACAEWTSP
jgi:hypothetical protein